LDCIAPLPKIYPRSSYIFERHSYCGTASADTAHGLIGFSIGSYAANPLPVTSTAPPVQTPAAQDDKNVPVRWSELLGEGNKIKFYGFLRLDMIFDSQRPNNAQTILFIPSPDPLTGNTTDGNFTMHPRLTRLGINYTG
jgi:hypothetical protein